MDERPFGGGPGMVMMAEPLAKAIIHAKQLADKQAVFMYPSGVYVTHKEKP